VRTARLAGLVALAIGLTGAAPLRDEPVVWYADDRRDIQEPAERDPSLVWDAIDATAFRPFSRLVHPGRLVRKVGTIFGGDHVLPAANINRLDEVPNSSWFTNRIGLFPISPEAAAEGPGTGGPDRSTAWTVIRAKSEGVTPGFTIRDGRGDTFLIKFDPPDSPGMASAAAVISGKILHAAGYNVPQDDIAEFRRADLVLAEGIQMTLPDGKKRTMTEEDLDAMMAPLPTDENSLVRAISSKYLSGKPVGPFDWLHRRKDDPNDHVNHEDRRELRGLRVIAAWLNHFDLKQLNTLDMYVEEEGCRFVRHHLIDFASSLGAGATRPQAILGFEYAVDLPAILGRTVAVGLHEDPWRKLERPEGLDEIGYFESELFEPIKAKPMNPNSSFANLTDRDGYWAAKIVSAFTDDHLGALVAAGQYANPEAAEYMTRMLGERRDKIARFWFDRIPPVDFFVMDGGVLRFRDLGEERGVYPGTTPRYRVGVSATTEDRKFSGWTEWAETPNPELDTGAAGIAPAVDSTRTSDYPFLTFQVRVDRGRGWSKTVTVHVARGSGRVVGIER
jgi:hypothetical protein